MFAGRSAKNTIMVDNSPKGIVQFENLIPINNFEGDPEDNALELLLIYLLQFETVSDVRPMIKRDFVDMDYTPSNSSKMVSESIGRRDSIYNTPGPKPLPV